jgi:FixJ family two-component response regulator
MPTRRYVRTIKAGAEGFLTKPIDIERLLGAILDGDHRLIGKA